MWRVRYALVLVLSTAACGTPRAGQPGTGPPAMPVQMDKVQASTLRDTTEYVANTRSRRSAQIQPQVAGYLTAILVESGKVARSGMPLMQIDPTRQRAVVSSQEATRAATDASLEFWRGQFARTKRLYTAGAATRQDFEQTDSQLRQAQAAAAASGAQARAQAVELRYYRVTAPFAGTVGDIPVRVGDYVTPSTLLTTIDDNDVLETYVDVPLEHAASLHVGTPLEILDSTGQVLASTQISFVSPRANADTQTILAKASVPSGIRTLRGGQFTRARIVWSERKGPTVPVLAIQNRNGQAFAWVVKPAPAGSDAGSATGAGGPASAGNPAGAGGPGGSAAPQVAEPRVVELGPIEGQRYPVLRGLAVGDTIVVSGVQKLRPGVRVVPVPPAQPDGGASPAGR